MNAPFALRPSIALGYAKGMMDNALAELRLGSAEGAKRYLETALAELAAADERQARWEASKDLALRHSDGRETTK